MNPMIQKLYELKPDKSSRDRGALAALRRGLGKSPGEAAEMYPVLMPMLDDRQRGDLFEICCLIAALYAFHPERTKKGNLGDHMRLAGLENKNDRQPNEATERRFVNLLRAHPDDLPDRLRQAIAFLKSRKEPVPVNWDQLYNDLVRYQYDPEAVQKSWAAGFWGYRPVVEDQPTTQTDDMSEE